MLNTGREDDIRRLRAIPEGEPVFIARAQDPDGAETARDWARRAFARGRPACLIELALQQADRMERWPVKKPVDADNITDPAPLEAAFRTRVWAFAAGPDEDALKAIRAEARAGGFKAGVRSLQAPLDRLRGENLALRRESAQLADKLAEALRARADLAEQLDEALQALSQLSPAAPTPEAADA